MEVQKRAEPVRRHPRAHLDLTRRRRAFCGFLARARVAGGVKVGDNREERRQLRLGAAFFDRCVFHLDFHRLQSHVIHVLQVHS